MGATIEEWEEAVRNARRARIKLLESSSKLRADWYGIDTLDSLIARYEQGERTKHLYEDMMEAY